MRRNKPRENEIKMFKDVHVHSWEDGTSGADVLRAMDKVEMEKMVVFSPPRLENDSNEAEIESIESISRLCAEDPERLIGFAWIEPTLSDAAAHAELAVNDKKLKGFKMIPNHWYPYEERFFPVYASIEKLGKPILFHSGILYAMGDSSRFCRPCFFEVLLHFPKIKFALAHIGWPWTDECIATLGRMRAASGGDNEKMQMYIDTTRGTPRFYRKEVLDKALKFAGPGRLIYGSDEVLPSELTKTQERVRSDHDIIVEELGYTEEDFNKIVNENFEDFLLPIS